ncbi:MAG: RecX family transcriptional regulator [Rhodospirillales bacterium]|nr:RecX family transcriptional regulator [Alphaproteobacteria bacterium]MCB9986136.1 RecX family transcriptional regulator [Rhodospirillales bacterium]USO07305.1 MAG: RecX family transcriptional regulator [Rhodospirillales bacterium]
MDQDKPKTDRVKRRKTPRKLSETYLRNAALYYLQRHPASVTHFLTVMGRKIDRSARAHHGQDVEAMRAFLRGTLVAEMERAGFLNDAQYAAALAASYRRRGLPERSVVMKLRQKGVEAPPPPEGHDEIAAAHLYARRKRLGPYATRARDPQKDLAAMARAGFSYDVCKNVLAGGLEDTPDDF